VVGLVRDVQFENEDTMTNDEYTSRIEAGKYPKGGLVPLDSPFSDDRGDIQNLVLKPMTSVAVITSKKGSVRANHYHKSDWHYAHIISGRILYFEREIGSNVVSDPQEFVAGQMFFTPPMVEHSMLFAEDTTFITMAKNVRSHDSHEADLVRVEFITSDIASKYVP